MASSSTRISELLVAIAGDLRSSKNSTFTSDHLDALESLSLAHGLSARQCHAVLRLAVGRGDRVPAVLASSLPPQSSVKDDLVPHKTRVPTQTVGLALLRLLRPAPDTRLGPAFVRDALGALGPDPGVLEFGGPRGPPPSERTDDAVFRPHVPMRVQAGLVTLLLRLLALPPVVATVGDQHVSLPRSFLTHDARMVLSDCYGVLFHYLDYATLRPALIRLLGALTRKRHVRPNRVTKLLALQVRDAALGPLQNKEDTTPSWLLQTYARYYPDLVIAGLTRGDEPTTSMNAVLAAGADAAAAAQTDPGWILETVDIARRRANPELPLPLVTRAGPLKRKADRPPQSAEEAEHEAKEARERTLKRRQMAVLRRALTRTVDGKVEMDLVYATAEQELEAEDAAADAAAAAGRGRGGSAGRRGLLGRGGLRARAAGRAAGGLGTLVGNAPGDREGGLLALLPSDTGAFGGESRGALLTVIRGFRSLGRRLDRLALPARIAVATAPAFTGSSPQSLTLAARLAVVATLLKPGDAPERLGDALLAAFSRAKIECEIWRQNQQVDPQNAYDTLEGAWRPALATAAGWGDAAGELPSSVADYLTSLLEHIASLVEAASSFGTVSRLATSRRKSSATVQLDVLMLQVPLDKVLTMLLPHVGLTIPSSKLKSIMTALHQLSGAPATPWHWRLATVRGLTSLLRTWSLNAPWAHWLGLGPEGQGVRAVYGWRWHADSPGERVAALPAEQLELVLVNVETAANTLVSASNQVQSCQPRTFDALEAFSNAWHALTEVAGLHSSMTPSPSALVHHLLAPQIVSPSLVAETIDRLRRSFEWWESVQAAYATGEPAPPLEGPPALVDLLPMLPNARGAGPAQPLPPHAAKKVREYYSDDARASINAAVVLLADCVWRMKGFATADMDLAHPTLDIERVPTAETGIHFGLGRRFFDDFDRQTEAHGLAPGTIGSLATGLAWFALAEQCLWTLLPDAPEQRRLPARAPLTSTALRGRRPRPSGPAPAQQGPTWTEFRARFLRWLDVRGAGGMYLLLSSIMSSLRQLQDDVGSQTTVVATTMSQP